MTVTRTAHTTGPVAHYLLPPQSPLALTPDTDTGFSLRAEQAIRLSGIHLLEFFKKLNDLLTRSPAGCTAQELACRLNTATDAILPLLEKLTQVGVLMRTEKDTTPFALLTASLTGNT